MGKPCTYRERHKASSASAALCLDLVLSFASTLNWGKFLASHSLSFNAYEKCIIIFLFHFPNVAWNLRWFVLCVDLAFSGSSLRGLHIYLALSGSIVLFS